MPSELTSQVVLHQLYTTLRLINAFSPSLSPREMRVIRGDLIRAYEFMGTMLELSYLTDGSVPFARELCSFFSAS